MKKTNMILLMVNVSLIHISQAQVSFSEPFSISSTTNAYIAPPAVVEMTKDIWPNYYTPENNRECATQEKLINLRFRKLISQMKIEIPSDAVYSRTRVGQIVVTYYNNKRPDVLRVYGTFCRIDLYLPKGVEFELKEELFEGPVASSDCQMQLALDHYLYGVDSDGLLRRPHFQKAVIGSACMALAQLSYRSQVIYLKKAGLP
jgi:hypothetical protein